MKKRHGKQFHMFWKLLEYTHQISITQYILHYCYFNSIIESKNKSLLSEIQLKI